jgi:DNA repair protein RadC
LDSELAEFRSYLQTIIRDAKAEEAERLNLDLADSRKGQAKERSSAKRSKKYWSWPLPEQERQLEELLAPGVGRSRSTELARDLIRHFGSLPAVLSASQYQLRRLGGLSPRSISFLKSLLTTAEMLAGERIPLNRPLLSSHEGLMEYLHVKVAYRSREELRALFLDHRNGLMADELLQRGTVNHVQFYTRELLARALELSAGGIILVHNYPAGDSTPTPFDKKVSREVSELASRLDMTLLDYITVGQNGSNSLRRLNWL